MQTRFAPARSRSLRLVALAALGLFASSAPALLSAAPLGSAQRAEILAEGRAQLSQRHEALRAQIEHVRGLGEKVELNGLKGKGAKAAKLSFRGMNGDRTRLILRVPGRGTGWGVRANDATGTLAAQLGRPEWVPAGVLAKAGTFASIAGVTVDSGRKSQADAGKVMVVEFVSQGYKDGEDAPVTWLRSIPEDSRLTAAVLDVLSLSRDRKLANVMVNKEGEIRLIDHDVTYGMKGEKGPHFPSAFWKGQSLAYTSKQRRFSDLPEHAKRVVQAIAEEEDLDALKAIYPLSREDRLPVLRSMAQAIVDGGLDAAVEGIVSASTQKGFLHLDEAPNAATLRAERGAR